MYFAVIDRLSVGVYFVSYVCVCVCARVYLCVWTDIYVELLNEPHSIVSTKLWLLVLLI